MSLEFIQANSQAFLIGGGAILIIAILWMLMLKFGFREKSFEEVVAEERQRITKEELLSKQEKGKKDKEKEKKHKKWGKRKEKAEQSDSKAPETLIASETISVSSETGDEIEVIEPKEVIPKKKQQKQAQKPTSAATVAVINAANTATISQNKTQEPQKQVITESSKTVEKKDSVDVPVTKDKEKPKIEAKSNVETQQASKVVEAEVGNPAAPVQPTQTVQQPASTANKKKKRVEQSDKTDVSNVTASNLISMLKEAALGDLESQMLIEVLLNKQKDAASWKKQAQNVKKQQQEKDNLHDADQKGSQLPSAKSKQETGQDKIKASAMEKLLQEKVSQLQQELQDYITRFKQAQELHTTAKANAQEKIALLEKETEAKLAAMMKKSEEEKNQLMRTVKKLESDSKSHITVAELETTKKSREDLQKVHLLLVDQHTQLIAAHKTEVKTLNAQLADSRKQIREIQDKNSTMQKEMESLKKKFSDLSVSSKTTEDQVKIVADAEIKVKQIQVQLEEAKRHGQELDAQLKIQVNKVAELTKENGKLASEVENLHTENERLSAELATTNERVAGDGQEMLQQNGEVDVKREHEQRVMEEKEKVLQEKEQHLSQLYDDLNACKGKIASLNEDLELQKQKNNELREKNWKAVEALASTEQKANDAQKDAEERLKEVQDIQEKLKQLQQIHESSASLASQELTQRLSDSERHIEKLQAELKESIKKYELETDKSKKLNAELKEMQLQRERLEKKLDESQQAVEQLKSEAQRTQQSCRSCLQKLFPAVTVDSTLPHDEWLKQFEQQAVNVVSAVSDSTGEAEKLLAQLSEAEVETSALRKKISNYEVVLSDTEAMLNELQDSAKSKEAEWEEKLSNKELEIQNVLGELEAVKSEKEKLSSSADVELKRIDQLQDEIKSLQQRLEGAENEKSSFQQKYDEVNKNYINVKDQIESKGKVIEDLKKEVSSFDHLKKELDDIKSKLEKEKKINKDFSSQMVRLNSLVKIGQDSLVAEQETVKKLQNQLNQLQATQVTTANGTSSPPAVEVNQSPSKSVKNEKVKKPKKSDASGKK